MAGRVCAGAGLAGLAFLAGCQVVLDFSPLASDGGGGDGTEIDAGEPDAFDLCNEREPNNALDSRLPITAGAFQAAICPQGDDDYYGFELDGTQDLAIVMMSVPAEGDLELELYDANSGSQLRVSVGTQPVDRIEYSIAVGGRLPAGSYAARVVGADTAVENDYDLTLIDGTAAVEAGLDR